METQHTELKEAQESAKKKPTGYDFYREVLGSPRYVVAPMVDGSELAWRILSRYYGAELCYTPMIHAGLYSDGRQTKYRAEQLDLGSAEEGHPSLDRPLIVQFCANHPDTLLNAANLVVNPSSPLPEDIAVDAVDLNLGCPQGIAKKGKYGAFLMDHPDLITQLISHLNQHIPVPVTAKYRRFETAEKTESYTDRLIEAGAQMISLHGRTREQKGQFTGLADWDMMRGAVVRSHERGRPILGNGNVLVARDVTELLRQTGADGAMVAEGNLYNPAIFAPLNGAVMARFRAGLPERFKLALGRVEEEYDDPSGKLGSPESLLEFPTSSKIASQYLAICRTLTTRTASSAIKGHLHKIFRPVFETGRYDDLRNCLAEVSWGSAEPSTDSSASHKRRDRAAYEGLLDRFDEVVRLVKLRLEDDRRVGLLDEHQIDMGLTRTEGESTPAFLARLRVPYSRCQPYVRALVAEQQHAEPRAETARTELADCAGTGCANSAAGRCSWGLCKRCCAQQSAECPAHLRRAELEAERRLSRATAKRARTK
ncbi:hypothetical protein PtA15_15A383 [Puccinia triticina]|nr:uncharacterized protein PtA15_15A383 [Puccinia triticina]WAQ91990.1 hypothetical protein PtA15_15A383 [Puccinia triticina]WAR62795.1 hypothetical protein PtB15_15B383 [Puccinia triticina]